ncbi:unnamed protein product [Hyaloperonospora brassicae]|uniref:RxLR effector candidate protein n=1 Tax=Hyaloperonospora brassicae TaxID=162125 RepID=A0AAV0TXQ0_HYABA|nr:unnamed protein product [Hyaloperonospora brassicae]CAI5738825.1 unnamed protein product [Hyaloperonospora brassicae]
MSAAAGVASSHTATADITTFQSTVHTTSRLPVHPHVPPVRYISASQAHIRVAGKRRRLNDDDPIPGDPDWDMETHDQQVERTVQANLMTLDTGITSRLDSFRSSLDTDVASPTVDVAVSGCPVTDDAPTSTPAVQRPLASAAVRTRATRLSCSYHPGHSNGSASTNHDSLGPSGGSDASHYWAKDSKQTAILKS